MLVNNSDSSEYSLVEIKNSNTINLKKNNKCIKIDMSKKLIFLCGLNVNATASSAKMWKNNSPCNTLMEKFTTFQFKPNDANPWIKFDIKVK